MRPEQKGAMNSVKSKMNSKLQRRLECPLFFLFLFSSLDSHLREDSSFAVLDGVNPLLRTLTGDEGSKPRSSESFLKIDFED